MVRTRAAFGRADASAAGTGSALARGALARLRASGAAGCVVLGDPAYYARFGFRTEGGR
ncbi:hypothetical protein [Caballeronia grimmiae]|uniref:hypothetical protein n=1 Tax=Caballeronia TaxID=1827195 RepID=UPI00286BDD21|nr:hypothetical protein [Caballeronia sp. LZ025]